MLADLSQIDAAGRVGRDRAFFEQENDFVIITCREVGMSEHIDRNDSPLAPCYQAGECEERPDRTLKIFVDYRNRLDRSSDR